MNYPVYDVMHMGGFHVLVLLQVAFGFSSPIPWDKSPNRYGQKTFAVDVTGEKLKKLQDSADLACVGNLLIMLAVHQGIISLGDLEGLVLGQGYNISDIVEMRNARKGSVDLSARDVKQMCGSPKCCHV